jgi:hypothetical protein
MIEYYSSCREAKDERKISRTIKKQKEAAMGFA